MYYAKRSWSKDTNDLFSRKKESVQHIGERKREKERERGSDLVIFHWKE